MKTNTKKIVAVSAIMLSFIVLCLGAFLICRWNFSYTGAVLWGNDENGVTLPLSDRDIGLATQVLDNQGISYELVNNNSLLLVQQYKYETAVGLLNLCRFESGYVDDTSNGVLIESGKAGFTEPILVGNENADYLQQPLSRQDIALCQQVLSDNGIECYNISTIMFVQKEDVGRALEILSGYEFESCHIYGE